MKHTILALASLLLFSCSDSQPYEDDRTSPSSGDAFNPELVDGGEQCPEFEPLMGMSCDLDPGEKKHCPYQLDECRSGGQIYPIYLYYCCGLSGLWERCGTNDTPCDRPGGGEPAPVVDASMALDQATARPDAGVDAPAAGGRDALEAGAPALPDAAADGAID